MNGIATGLDNASIYDLRPRLQVQTLPTQIQKHLGTTPTRILPPDYDAGHMNANLQDAVKKALGLSQLAYDPLDYAEQQLKLHGYDHAKSFSKWFTGTQAVCGVKDGYSFIVFRGSASFLDWLVDFTLIPFFWPLRHLGFELAWRSVRGEIRGWLEEIPQAGGKGIILCGHSLGGGIAHLAAFSLAGKFAIANVITFGAPKVSFLGTAAKYDNMLLHGAAAPLGDVTYCVVNQRDIVAKVPPEMLGFRDVGRLIYIDRQGLVHVGDAAAKICGEESMTDIDSMLNFFQEEQGSVANASPKLTGWDAFYYYFQNGVRWLVKCCPALRTPLMPPVFYMLTSLYFMRSGLAHLTGKYASVFFDLSAGSGFTPYKPSPLKQALSSIIRIGIGVGLIFLFLMGLIYIAAWSMGPLFRDQ